MDALELTLQQGEQIVQRHLPGHRNTTVKLITEIKNNGYSFTSGIRTYVLDLALGGISVPSCLCFLTISRPNTNSGESTYQPHSLPIVYNIISRIRSHTDIPIPDPILDTSLDTVPFHFLLSPTSPILSSDIISLSTARRSGLLDPQHTLFVDLQIGRFLGQLHHGVQNDWFGTITLAEPSDPSYSWQETFTLLIENLLSHLESTHVDLDLPYQQVRGYLSRAIASFLFDDVEVPSLIWLTGSEDDIYIAIPSGSGSDSDSESANNIPRGIAAILPNVAHALWGDPLLETFFLPPAPSPALKEGYLASGGIDPILFPRQNTKRIWYSLFLGLLVLRERSSNEGAVAAAAAGEEKSSLDMDKEKALDLIHKSIQALADAPCY